MKYKKYLKFYLSRVVFDHLHYKLELVAPDFEYDLDVFYSILNDLSNIKYHKQTEHDYYFKPLYSGLLLKKYGIKYNRYLTYLVVHCIIVKTSHYYKGTCYYFKLNDDLSILDNAVRTYTYCFINTDRYDVITLDNTGEYKNTNLGKSLEVVEIKIDTKSNVGKMITGYHNRELDRIKKYPKHIKMMKQYINDNLELNVESAKEYTINKFKRDEVSANGNDDLITKARNAYDQRIRSILAIGDKSSPRKLRFNRNGTNKRLDTDLTNMAADLRPFIKGYDQMSYLDLSNSQPVLFNIMLNKFKPTANKNLLIEIDEYKELTLSGRWYEYLIKVFGINTGDSRKDRDVAKERWMEIAYSKNKSWKDNKRIFARNFAQLNDLIMQYKVKEHGKFSIELQKIESQIFIGQICKELVDVGIIPYSLHDGLMVPKDREEETYQIMAKVLKANLGAVPVIAINGEKRYPKEAVSTTPKIYDKPLSYIEMGELQKSKSRRTIGYALRKWNKVRQGDVTIEGLVIQTEMGKKTIEKYWNEFDSIIRVINGTDPETLAKQEAQRQAIMKVARQRFKILGGSDNIDDKGNDTPPLPPN